MARFGVWTSRVLVIIGIAAALTFVGAQMGLFTGKRPDRLGLQDGRLHTLKKDAQNAVSSFSEAPYSQIKPITASKDPRGTFSRLVQAVKATPGATIVKQDPNYLYAEFQTPLLKFVDDVEFLLDEGNAVIHVRSASRLGRKDFGVNRKRIETLREAVRTTLG
jgi:uncharacterized protein (DUF1499 family)